MSDDVYCYPPDFAVFRNKLGLRDGTKLNCVERRLVAIRGKEPMPNGDFDLRHLCAIHFHLFQDVYDWAGQVRKVEISKDGSQFQFRQYIETGMSDVHRRIRSKKYLRSLPIDEFAIHSGKIIGDVNYVHPFRDGNGRTQLYYYKQLAEQAGFEVDLLQLNQQDWMAASQQAHFGDYTHMANCLRNTILEPD